MRELGRKGGKSRRGLNGKLPESERASLVEALRAGLNHDVVVGAVERALAGGNESARVAAVKLLTDLEPYRRDDCPECAAREGEAAAVHEQAERKLADLIVGCVAAILSNDLANAPGFAAIAVDRLDADLRARIAELH